MVGICHVFTPTMTDSIVCIIFAICDTNNIIHTGECFLCIIGTGNCLTSIKFWNHPPLNFCPLHSRIDQGGKTARTLIDLPQMGDWAPRLVPLPSSSVTVPYNCGQLCTLVPKPQQLFLLPGQSVWNPKRSHFQTGEVPLLLNQFCLKNMNALVLKSGS